MPRKPQKIAIIGYGRFGRLAAHYLKRQFKVVVANRSAISSLEAGVKQVEIEAAASCPTVILSVSINAIPATLRDIKPYLRPDAIVLDVCSVKEKPVEWMKKTLPPTVRIIGTHPLFGPDSAAKSLAGRNIVLTPARASTSLMNKLKAGMNKAGLNVYVMTPAEHDKLMAWTLFLTQFIGRGLGGNLLPTSKITTQNFENLRQLVYTTGNDTSELFRDMFRYNKFARNVPKEVLGRLWEAIPDV